jgi:4-methylaminobutanoate oxidase (formaldehyde-forming)
MTTDQTPYQAGLQFAVSKEKEFLGKKGLLAAPATKKLVTITLEDPRAVVLSNEPVRINGAILGRVTSGGYGIAVGASIAFAYIPAELATVGTSVEILVFGNWIKGTIVKGPIYDPKGERVRS